MPVDTPPAIIQPTLGSQFKIELPRNFLSNQGDPISIISKPATITFYGPSSTPIATIDTNGHVEYKGTPDEAAKAFWRAVEQAGWCGKEKP